MGAASPTHLSTTSPEINLRSVSAAPKLQRGTDNQHYDHDTVIILLSIMKLAGYGDWKQQIVKGCFHHRNKTC